ncbi:MAG: helix-turn-helix transcriptional regulator [Clostridia bacterium]|nr:helix-turn-helix transcriptional regulator [Clostridia bacterium]
MNQTYYKHKIENLLIVSKIATIHYLELEKDFSNAGERHDFWELVYADKSSVVCTAEDKEITLGEGEVLFHKPNEFHRLSANSRSAPNVVIISFVCKSEAIHFFEGKRFKLNKNNLKYLYMIVEESKKTFDLPYSDPDLKKMPLQKRPTLGGMQLIKNLLEILLVNIMRDETEKENTNSTFLFKEDFDGYVAKKIIGVLNESVHGTLCVDELCEKLNYNKSYLFRQFKAATGRTIMSYFTNLKVEGAKKMLRESDGTVAQIAAAFAFDTPNYFSKTFKKITGYTPLQYKKIHRRKN